MALITNYFQSFVAILLLLFLLPLAAKGDDDFSPSQSPFFDNLCDEVECGRGRCEANPRYPFGFRCDCDDGWRRTRLDDEQNLEFLPCTIPNCSVDYSCMAAPPPLPPVAYNLSSFDPCYWIYCGEGRCTKNETHRHTCQCNTGYSNLLNISAFPCYPDCAIGSASCERLGIRVSSSTNSNSSPGGGNSNGAAKAISLELFNWVAILVAMIMVK